MKVDYEDVNILNNAPFKYLLITGYIDYWRYSLTEDQVVGSISKELPEDQFVEEYSDFMKKIDYVRKTVTSIEDEAPHIIRFTGIPDPENNCIDLVVIAKISNNGTCFIFSNNYHYLKSINK